MKVNYDVELPSITVRGEIEEQKYILEFMKKTFLRTTPFIANIIKIMKDFVYLSLTVEILI